MKTGPIRRRLLSTAVLLIAAMQPLFVVVVRADSPAPAPGPAIQATPAAAGGTVPTAAPPGDTVPPAAVDPNTLPPVFQPSPIPLGHGLLVGGALDLRTRTADTGRTGGIWVNAAELDLQHPITSKGKSRGNIVLQIIAEDPPDIHRGRDIQLGEAYILYKLPIHSDYGTTAFLKLGQFQLPFALLGVYDPHLRIVQPLYSQSLGLRTDWGVGLSGTLYGYLQYDAALTTGTGPNHADVDPNRLVTFRLGRTFNTRNGVVNFGGSLLSGRLPVTNLDKTDPFAVELPPSGRVRSDRYDTNGDRYTPKTRIAIDTTYRFKSATARGEALAGADKNNRVQGYYGEADYRFTRRATATAAYSLFVYPVGNSTTSRGAGGVTYQFSAKTSVSAVYEYLRDVPRDAGGQVRHRFTVQMLIRF